MDTATTVHEAVGGDAALLRLARAWHERVLADEVVSHAFSHGFHPQHTERLAAYWAEALGGPPTYTQRYGDESSVVRLHSGNGQHDDMDQRAIACSTGPWTTSACRATTGAGRCCTTSSRGPPRRR